MKKDTVATEDVKLVEYIVPNGEIRNIVLPDSSHIRLNAGSILIYPQRFIGKTRTVYLNGEAYFNVARNETQPFIVNTTDMEVEVLGTVFNVHSYTDSKNSSATLESGKVNVRFKNTIHQAVTLVPNERVSFDRNSGFIEKQTVKVENVVAWTNGYVVLQSTTIEEIAKIIERRYGVSVYLNSHKYRNERITMKLDGVDGVVEFMNVLRHLIPGFRYKLENDKLYIY
jgi:ferric-dicitrate binding protein FerR (iron transport regulator)